jgi:hypothetical protein
MRHVLLLTRIHTNTHTYCVETGGFKHGAPDGVLEGRRTLPDSSVYAGVALREHSSARQALSHPFGSDIKWRAGHVHTR